MKRFIKFLLVFSLIFLLSGCVNSPSSEKSDLVTIVVGATPLPHAEILNVIKDDLKTKGVELEIKEFTDYVTPNTALKDKQIDANFFQHLPYLESFIKSQKAPLISIAGVHIEPMAGYSLTISSIDDLPDGSSVAIPNDATNEGRALILLMNQGLITLNSPDNLTATPNDITKNPKNLKFIELEAAQLPRSLEDVDLAVINTNYALEANLNPIEDNLFIENDESPYVNILVAREDNQNDKAIKLLVEAIQSQKVKDFIMTEYGGAVIPAFK